MSAPPFATSLPLIPMATPTSACCKEGASLTPSPVMEAISPLEGRDIDFVALMRVGDAVYQISQLAKDLNVKYIVMGSRGMGLIRGTVLGSVSTGVLHETKIPVLIIPQKEK